MILGRILPLTARITPSNHLELGGCDTIELAERYGTPLYVLDRATLFEQARFARAAFSSRWPDVTVLYASKAYLSPFMARFYRDLGLGLDITSSGELEIARRVHFPPERIYLHGNCKTRAEIRAVLRCGVEHIVLDSVEEIPLIASLAEETSRIPKLLVRISPDIEPHTHRFLATGTAEGKFGLGITNGEADRAFREIERHPTLRLVGLHVHIGSQVFEQDSVLRAMDCALDVAAAWHEQGGFDLRELNVGGGWGVAYTEEQEAMDPDRLADQVCRALASGLAEREMQSPVRLIVEPGRALVARAGVALYRVGSIKRVSPTRTYAAVDGGMGDNIRPSLYGARYSALVANKAAAPAEREYSIAGRYCEQGDVLIDSAALPDVQTDDLIAVPAAGAYQLPMASNYNLIPRPAIVLVDAGKSQLLRRRETIDDMLACDTGMDG